MNDNSELSYQAKKKRIEQLANQGRYLDLRKYTAELLASDPEFSYALMFNGLSYCKMDDSSGFVIMERALAMEPDNGFYYFMVSHANATNSHKNAERSLELIKKAIELRPNNIRYREFAGELLSQERQFEKALVYFDEALELDADNPVVHAEIAYCKCQLGFIEEAREGIEEALRQDPGSSRIHMLRAYIYYDFCEYEKSRDAMQFCLINRPDDVNIRYTYLMAHHGFVSGLFFRPTVIKFLQKLTIIIGCFATLIQLIVLCTNLNQVWATTANYVTTFFIFYLFIRGFMSTFLVWRMQKTIRETMFIGRKAILATIYANVFIVTCAFIADLVFRSNLSHSVFWGLLHLSIIAAALFYRRLFSKRDKILTPIYFGISALALLLLLKYNFMVYSGMLLFFIGYLIGPYRNYFIRISKINLGFDKEGEDDFSF